MFANGRVFGFGFLALLQHPFYGTAIAEFILPRLFWNARQRGFLVNLNGSPEPFI
jgi:uncharacterized protein YqgC (DUF456 family)